MATRRQVPQERYDREYLLSDNTEGYQEFLEGRLSFVKQHQIEQLDLRPGVRLLEVGFGRGEFLYHCAKRGAVVTAIDYSEAALEVAKDLLADFPDADLRTADCRDLPFESDTFDRIYCGDVLEHVDAEDGVSMLREMYRVLAPGGFIYLHTAPNTVFTRFVLPIVKPILRFVDAQAVNTLEEHMKVNETVHVHEYNLVSLRRAVRRAGLSNARVWIGEDVLRSSQHRHTRALSESWIVRLAGRLGRLGPARFFLGNDLYVKCVKTVATAGRSAVTGTRAPAGDRAPRP